MANVTITRLTVRLDEETTEALRVIMARSKKYLQDVGLDITPKTNAVVCGILRRQAANIRAAEKHDEWTEDEVTADLEAHGLVSGRHCE